MTAQAALASLATWAKEQKDAPRIAAAILEWTENTFASWEGATDSDVIRHLETIDCAACHAPPGLIYNHEIAEKVSGWWDEIDAALYAYQEEMGEPPRPRDKRDSLTINFLVWFAVEWWAQDAVHWLYAAVEEPETTE